MPRLQGNSKEIIKEIAKHEFLEMGYQKANMRSIGAKAGMTQAGIYRHFLNKEEMFNEIVEPCVKRFYELFHENTKAQYNVFNETHNIEVLLLNNNIDIFKEIFHEYHDEMTLLLKCSKGTDYENFIYDVIYLQQNTLLANINFLNNNGYNVKHIDEDNLHVLLSAYTTAVFEPIAHNWDEDKLSHSLDVFSKFATPGWRSIMGL